MGKKSGDKQAKEKEEKARAFVLRVDMHCKCDGCINKIRAAVKDITSHQGIQSWDQSALDTKGELRLLATADPEKLQQRLRKATRKNVDLLFPTVVPNSKEKQQEQNKQQGNKDAAAAAQVQALLLNSLQQQGHQGQQIASWANNNQNQLLLGGGGGWNAHAGLYGGYPSSWAVQQQQPQPVLDPYAAAYQYHPAAGAGWGGGAYSAAYPPQGAYGWHGHGY